jgi:vancomycin resistance protein YoaR
MRTVLEELNRSPYLVFGAVAVSIVANIYLIANAHRHWNDVSKPKVIKYIIINGDNKMSTKNVLNPLIMSASDMVRYYEPETEVEKHMLYLLEEYGTKLEEELTKREVMDDIVDTNNTQINHAISELESINPDMNINDIQKIITKLITDLYDIKLYKSA